MLSILQELGLDPQDLEWQDLGLCNGYDLGKGGESDVFYDAYETDEEVAKAADEMCLSCPVMKQCSLAGMRGEIGLWGGVYWNGSGNPDKNRNSHKTAEVWERIKERIQ